MHYRASPKFVEQLLNQPETGMGYQIIETKFISRSRFLVYNSEILIQIPFDFNFNRNYYFGYRASDIEIGYLTFIDQFTKHGYDFIVNNSKEDVFFFFDRVIQKSELIQTECNDPNRIIKYKRSTGTIGAANGKEEVIDKLECFSRLTPFKDDKRIDYVAKKYMPGTYATTTTDYLTCIITNDDPIDRYALPSDIPIKYAFHCVPAVNKDRVQRGTVQPAFNHCGGGLEAFFKYGTSDNTFLLRTSYDMDKRIKIKEEHQALLLNQPENGMGYHIVDLRLIDGSILTKRIILNSSYLILDENEDIESNQIRSIELHKG